MITKRDGVRLPNLIELDQKRPGPASVCVLLLIAPDHCTAFWSSGASCGPAPAILLRDEVRKARASGDWTVARQVAVEVKASQATLFPKGDVVEFAKYNIGLEKARIDAAGWMRAGPCRPPYHLIPAEYLDGARASGQAWADLNRRYCKEAEK